MLDLIAFAFVEGNIVLGMIVVPIVFLVRPLLRPRGYCVKERTRTKIIGAHTVIFRNGKMALQGKCSSCGSTVFRIK